MTLQSPSLQRAHDNLMARRSGSLPATNGRPASGQNRHARMDLAYYTAGQNPHGPMLYFIVRYCTECKRGTAIDLVREVPEGTPSAHDLGLKQAKPWRLKCLA